MPSMEEDEKISKSVEREKKAQNQGIMCEE